MKRQDKRNKLLKQIAIAQWVHTGFNPNCMATIIDIQSILQDPYAYLDILLNAHDLKTANKILDAIADGDFETHIHDTANALREKDDYTGKSSVQSTKDMLGVMGIDLFVYYNP